jgi:heat shock protein HspQ
MTKVDLSDFQKKFLLGQGAGQTLYTEKEFSEALAQAKAEIMAVAIQTTKQAIFIERQACAEMAYAYEAKLAGKDEDENFDSPLANNILNRIPTQRQ